MTPAQKAATYFSSRFGGAALPLPVAPPVAEALVGCVAEPGIPAAGALFVGTGLRVGVGGRLSGADSASFSTAPGVSAR
jgi:hypothetical protein